MELNNYGNNHNLELAINNTEHISNEENTPNTFNSLNESNNSVIINDLRNINMIDSEKVDTIDQIINGVGITRYHFKIYTVISLFLIADGAEMIVISLLVTKLTKLWELSVTQKGFLGSSVFIGVLCGALIAGKLSDIKGRKPVYVIGSLIVFIFSLITAFSPSYIFLLIFRALNGFGIGMCIPSLSSLAAEITPTNSRAWVLNLIWLFFPVGEIIAVLIGNYTSEYENGWRMLLAFSAIPSLIAFLLSFFINESFRFYFSNKHFENGFIGLNKLIFYSPLKKLSEDQKEKIRNEINSNSNTNIKSEFKTLFTKSYIRLTGLSCIIFFISSFVYYGVIYILPQTIDKINNSNDIKVESDKKDFFFGMFLSVIVEIPSSILTAYISNNKYIGRIKSMMIGFFLTILSSVLCAIFINNISFWASFIKFSISIPFGVIYLYVSEAFPTKIRTIAIGFTNSFTRYGGILTPIVSEWLFYNSIITPYIIYSIAGLIGLVTAIFLPFETLGKNII